MVINVKTFGEVSDTLKISIEILDWIHPANPRRLGPYTYWVFKESGYYTKAIMYIATNRTH